MNQLKLELDDLRVESFDTTASEEGSRNGTVHGQQDGDVQKNGTYLSCQATGCYQSDCTCSRVIECVSRVLDVENEGY